MTDLAKLVVRLEAETARYQSELDRARGQLNRFDRESSATLRRIGLAAGAAVTAAAGGFALMVKSSIDAADELSKLSQKVGIATDDLSKLNYAAGLSGVETAALQTGLQKLSRNLVDAADGTGTAAKAFSALGVSVKNTDGSLKDNQTLLLELADVFSKLPDGPQKTAVAMDIFGKAGADLIPLLNGGSKAIRDMGTELEQLGGVITPEAGRQAEAFNDNLSRLTIAAGGVANQLAAQFLPQMVALTEQMVAAAKNTDAVSRAADGLRIFLGVLVVPVVTLWNALQLVVESFAAVGAAITALASGDFKALDAIGEAFGEDRRQNIQDIKNAYNTFFGDLKTGTAATGAAAAKAGGEFAGFSTQVNTAADAAAKAEDKVQGLLDALREESVTFGLSERAITLRNLALAGASQAQIEAAASLLDYLALQKQVADAQAEAGQVFDATRTPLENYRAELEKLDMMRARFDAGLPGGITEDTYRRRVGQLNEELARTRQGLDGIKDKGEDAFGSLSVYAEQAARNMQDAVANFLVRPFEEGFDGLLRSFADTLQQMAAQAAAAQIFDGFKGSGGLGDLLGPLGSVIGGFFGGGGAVEGAVDFANQDPFGPVQFAALRDSGGRGMAGQSYAIGTGAQPELFVPDTAGTFYPRDQWQGGGAPQITINVPITATSGTVSEATRNQVATRAARAASQAMRKYS